MNNEKNAIITYQGATINLFWDERADYVSLTDIYTAWHKYNKSINAWLKTRQTLEFLDAWEKKHNQKYDPTQLSRVIKLARERNGLSVQAWIEATKAKGIFTRSGERAGTYAHKDIAIKFAGWLNPEFELHLIEEIQRLKDLEKKINSLELLDEKQILALIQLKEVFKYVAHQTAVENANKDLYAARSKSKNPFQEFNKWRNDILDIDKDVINERIKQYCIENRISLTTANKLMKQPKREQLLILDSFKSVKNAVWDFLTITGEVNALHLSNLVEKMIRIEGAQVIRENKTDLFHIQQDLGEFSEFEKQLASLPQIKTAREVLEYRKEALKRLEERKKQPTTTFDKALKGLLSVPSPEK